MMSVVADKTGYPAEMLGAHMDLEADLGIDSIKRVEILAALRERAPGLPEVKPEHLGTLQTLGDIAAFRSAAHHGQAARRSRPAQPRPARRSLAAPLRASPAELGLRLGQIRRAHARMAGARASIRRTATPGRQRAPSGPGPPCPRPRRPRSLAASCARCRRRLWAWRRRGSTTPPTWWSPKTAAGSRRSSSKSSAGAG